MGTTKSQHFTDEQNRLATLLKALAHPARIAILEYLLSVDACINKDLVTELPLAQPTISQHLRELKDAGIIQGNIEGKSVCYCLNPNGLDQILEFITKTSSSMNEDKCC